MRGRLPTSNNAAAVHEFEENGMALRSVCGSIEVMPYAITPTEDPLSCAGCGAVLPPCGCRMPANPDPNVHYDCAVNVGPPDQGRLW